MKRKIIIMAICAIGVNLFSQTYKLESIFKDVATETYLSYWKVLENTDNNQNETFSLWGYQRYFDDWANGAYEVEYFKGNAKETYQFLNRVVAFTEKYKEQDMVLTNISGAQLKTLKVMGIKFTLLFDKERKTACKFNLKQWNEILAKFVSYCENQKIEYK